MEIRVGAVFAVLVAVAVPARASVRVFLERDGFVTDNGAEIPRFGGGDHTWNAVVACVRKQYAPFAVEIVDQRPSRGPFITAVIGGKASQLGLDDDTTNGVGPFSGEVERDAVVHIFSRVGTGERDVENLCAVTAHEVGHALGLDHEVLCGDVMSYYLDQCGARRFIDKEAPCGEHRKRRCATGEASQSSYRRLGELVGFRDGAAPEQADERDRESQSDDDDSTTTISPEGDGRDDAAGRADDGRDPCAPGSTPGWECGSIDDANAYRPSTEGGGDMRRGSHHHRHRHARWRHPYAR